jgi:thiol-disulfide isomerase/thioredoxin
VHFWASWCGPCVPEIPEILAAAKKTPKDQSGRDIYWVLISQDASWDKATSVLKEEMLTTNVISIIDPEAKVSDQFGTYQFPETYLVNRDGGIAAKWIGSQQWSGAWGEKVAVGIESLSRLKKVPE